MSSTSPCRPETSAGPTTATGRPLETRSRTSSPPSIWCRPAVTGEEPSWTSSSRARGTSQRSATSSGTRGTRFASRRRHRSPSPPPASSRRCSLSPISAGSGPFPAKRCSLTVSSTRDSCQRAPRPRHAAPLCQRGVQARLRGCLQPSRPVALCPPPPSRRRWVHPLAMSFLRRSSAKPELAEDHAPLAAKTHGDACRRTPRCCLRQPVGTGCRASLDPASSRLVPRHGGYR